MVRFYDPVNHADQSRVEKVLREGAIEYFLHREPESGLGPWQIHVAEEDVPLAEQLLLRHGRH